MLGVPWVVALLLSGRCGVKKKTYFLRGRVGGVGFVVDSKRVGIALG